jgi:hypothetical protein
MLRDSGEVDPTAAVFEEEQHEQAAPNTESTWKKSTARMLVAKAVRNCFQVGPVRCGEGSIPAALRIFHTVEAATV